MMTNVTCISPRRCRLTPAKTSAVYTSHPIILAIITNTRVLTTMSADSAIRTCYATRFPVTPAICTADTTNREQDGTLQYTSLYTMFTSLTRATAGLDICPLPADVRDSCFRGGRVREGQTSCGLDATATAVSRVSEPAVSR